MGASATRPEKPRWYRIGEVAEIVGEKPSVLRFWESEFTCVRPQKSRSGQRVYAQRDVDALLTIRSLLKDKRYTIEGARKQLRLAGVEPADFAAPDSLAVGVLRGVLLDIRRDALALLERLENDA